MHKIENAVDEYDDDTSNLIGYQKITGHMTFEFKMGKNLGHKDRFVANGHKTETPISINYRKVMPWNSVRMFLTIAFINGIYGLAAKVESADLSAPCCEQVWMSARPEFGNQMRARPEFVINEGKLLVIRKTLYSLKCSGAAFRSFLA